ncbi:unnamed protein product [Angiostrongylus costaricensis]|uniref:G_PROTEIN_RECEP_F1_2 domain-containing protein n=1 Tax=Angiostrongylus costaricensis TaxID=334426 RepID=A0A0R3PZ06_ANGCS|nr:unnamed protein product [Angiostrongylus costaricensis]
MVGKNIFRSDKIRLKLKSFSDFLRTKTKFQVKFFLISVVGSLIGLFGLFGNASTALILTRPSMRNPNNLFLTALAVFDSCLLITAFFIYAMEYIIEYTQAFNLYVAWLTYLRFAFALSHISQTGSVYITVSVTIERYLAVTMNPLCPDGKDWQSYILLPSMMAANPLYQQVYALWLTNIVMVFLPFLTLLVLNAYIAYTIRKSLEKLDDHHDRVPDRSQLKEKSRQATLVLVMIVCIFLICNFWGFVLTLLERIVDHETLMIKHHAFYTFSREAINFLAIINSSINFVIYIIFGKDFRRELVVVYGCGVRGVSIRLPVIDKFHIWRIWNKRAKEPRCFVCLRRRGSRRCDKPSSISTHEFSALDGLEQTQLSEESLPERNATDAETDIVPIRNKKNEPVRIILLEPINGTAGRKTVLTLYSTVDDEMPEHILFTSEEGTLC